MVQHHPRDHSEIICKIVFSRKVKLEDLKSHLSDLGLRRSTIFPDVLSFVQELREKQEWG